METGWVVYSFYIFFYDGEKRNGRCGLKGATAFKIRTAGSYLYINGNEKREGNVDDDQKIGKWKSKVLEKERRLGFREQA